MLSIYKASAGSGKTFTLVYEYIKMLLGVKPDGRDEYRIDSRTRDRHRRLLAITFTNKATDEMKHRIIHELAVLAGCEPAYRSPGRYMDMLTADLHVGSEVVSREARRALEELLFDYSSFNVSTIDSFFQSILRTFAREAELTGNYEVNLDDRKVVDTAVAETFRSVGESDQKRTLTWMTQVLLQKARAGEAVDLFNRSSRIYNDLVRFISTMSGETYRAHADRMEEYFSDPGRIDRFTLAIHERRAALIGEVSAKAKAALQVIADNPGVTVNLVKGLRGWIDLGPTSKLPKESATVRKVYNDTSTAFKASAPGRKALSDPQLVEAIASACEAVIEGRPELVELRIIASNLHFMGLAAAVSRRIDEFKRENNTLLLSDTNSLLRRIIGDDEAPFVYERMGMWIDHYLIDEFQDTSRMQWENLRPLVSESLSTGNDSLIIGDEKQCIYRFRNSDPDLLTSGVGGDLPGMTVVRGDRPGENTNWRSSCTVVEFNNMLFEYWAEGLKYKSIYGNVCQQVGRSHLDHPGYVDVRKVDDLQAALDRMCRHITRQLRSGYKPNDIAVLTRNRREAVGAINRMLVEIAENPLWRDVRIISDDAILLGNSPAVRQVICAMKRMLTARLSASRRELNLERRSKNYTLGEEMRARLLNKFENYVSRGLAPESALRRATCEMRDLDPAAPEDDGDECCTDLWSMTGPGLPTLVSRLIERCIAPDVYASEQVYLSALVDTVNDFAERGLGDIQNFLSWWESSGRLTPLAAPDDDNAMRVMTIHKSKGLEFKCVHIPAAVWRIDKMMDAEWFETPALKGIDQDIIPPLLSVLPSESMSGTGFAEHYERRYREQVLDELNVTYVAFTRAVDELVVSYYSPKSNNLAGLLDKAVGALGAEVAAETQDEDADDGETGVQIALCCGCPTSAKAEKKAPPTALMAGDSQPIPAMRPTGMSRHVWDDIQIDPDTINDDSPRQHGIVIHDIMAGVRDSSDLHRAVRMMVRKRALPLRDAGVVESKIRSLIDSVSGYGWFDGFSRVLTERSIALPDADRFGNARRLRPDRVVWTSDGYVDVIDYKTGEKRPGEHSSQIREYMRALRDLGHTNIRGFIWYFESNDIVQVSLIGPGD